VQHVQLVQRHLVDDPLDIGQRHEAAGRIEHYRAVAESRSVHDLSRRNVPFRRHLLPRLDAGRQELPQSLHGAERAFRSGRGNHDSEAGDRKPVVFCRQALVQSELDHRTGLASRGIDNRQLPTGSRSEPGRQILANRTELRTDHDLRRRFQLECPTEADDEALRPRDDRRQHPGDLRYRSRGLTCRQRRSQQQRSRSGSQTGQHFSP